MAVSFQCMTKFTTNKKKKKKKKKTSPFGFIEFLLELKREEGVRGEKRTGRETFF